MSQTSAALQIAACNEPKAHPNNRTVRLVNLPPNLMKKPISLVDSSINSRHVEMTKLFLPQKPSFQQYRTITNSLHSSFANKKKKRFSANSKPKTNKIAVMTTSPIAAIESQSKVNIMKENEVQMNEIMKKRCRSDECVDVIKALELGIDTPPSDLLRNLAKNSIVPAEFDIVARGTMPSITFVNGIVTVC